jgi:hypothetical protein
MASTVTLDIAATVKAALEAIVPSGTTVYSDGIMDATGREQDDRIFPLVSILVNECQPMQYKSVLRTYPLAISAATWYLRDRDQVDLYTLGYTVSEWLANGPSLSLTLAHFDAIYCPQAPERGIDGNVQYFRWSVEVKTRKAVAE